MRIGVNTRLLLAGKMDGIGWFTAETLKRITTTHPEHEFFFFFDRKPDPRFLFASNVHPVTLCPQARHPILWYLFFETSIHWALKHYHIDLFLSPECYMSLRTNVPTLTVFHDINYEHTQGNLKPSHQRYMDRYSHRFAHKSTRIATVSAYSKQDLITTYHLSPNKIDIVYDGAHQGYQPLSTTTQQKVRQKYTNGCPYFIFIGTILKRKNLATLLTAFDKFKETDNQQMKLLVVGHRVWWQDELEEAYDKMQHKDDVIWLGRAEETVLTQLLGSATSLVFPSLFEGFGIPIIESFHAEVAVITSNCTSMPEVAGDAALLIEPTNADQLCEKLQLIATDEMLRKQLIEKGKKQREKFSWDITSQLLWESMEKTIQEGRKR